MDPVEPIRTTMMSFYPLLVIPIATIIQNNAVDHKDGEWFLHRTGG
jgi:hypothetical protein